MSRDFQRAILIQTPLISARGAQSLRPIIFYHLARARAPQTRVQRPARSLGASRKRIARAGGAPEGKLGGKNLHRAARRGGGGDPACMKTGSAVAPKFLANPILLAGTSRLHFYNAAVCYLARKA